MSTEERIKIHLDDNGQAINLFGNNDQNLKLIEKYYNVKIVARGEEILLSGHSTNVDGARGVLQQLQASGKTDQPITQQEVYYAINMVREGNGEKINSLSNEVAYTTTRGKQVKAKTFSQKKYLDAVSKHDIVFGIGPAGTGKTYLAVLKAVQALRNKEVLRIVLTRPAVEAGEKLGFLPGDLQEKVNPYLRPLYDSLYDLLGVEVTQKYMEKQIIEIAPLAYMRGRTLDDAFIILDEAQNTTSEQMKMFLTRLGSGSKAVITGDITQVDLPRGQHSGLIEVQKILNDIEGIAFQYFSEVDVVRHQLVQRIIKAYQEKTDKRD